LYRKILKMSAEIHRVGASPLPFEETVSNSKTESKEKNAIQTDVSDIEADGYLDGEIEEYGSQGLVKKAEKTELTPVEVFK
jgi:hypothetical protein